MTGRLEGSGLLASLSKTTRECSVLSRGSSERRHIQQRRPARKETGRFVGGWVSYARPEAIAFVFVDVTMCGPYHGAPVVSVNTA